MTGTAAKFCAEARVATLTSAEVIANERILYDLIKIWFGEVKREKLRELIVLFAGEVRWKEVKKRGLKG